MSKNKQFAKKYEKNMKKKCEKNMPQPAG